MALFTKAEIAEIRQRLAAGAVKDTDFLPVSELQDNDLMALVREGANRKIPVKAISNRISSEITDSAGDVLRELSSRLTITAEELRSEYNERLSNTESGLTQDFSSVLSQTAREIRAELTERISDAKGNLLEDYESYLSLTAREFRAGLSETLNDLESGITERYESELSLTARRLSAQFSERVSDSEGNLLSWYTSELEMTARMLRTEFNTADTDLETGLNTAWRSELLQTARELTTTFDERITDSNGQLVADYTSQISQTARYLRSEYQADIVDSAADLEYKYQSLIQQTAQSLTTSFSERILDSEGRLLEDYSSRINQTAREISAVVEANRLASESGYSDLYSSFRMTAGLIATKVSQTDYDADNAVREQRYSEIEQTADAISAQVVVNKMAADGSIVSLRSSFEMTAQMIQAQVSDSENNISSLRLLANMIEARVSDAEGNVSLLAQTAESISARVADSENNVALLQITSSEITSRVGDAEGNLSAISQTAEAIRSAVSDVEGNVSSLTQTASMLDARVSDSEGNLADLQITAGSIASRVSDAEGNLSAISQTADEIKSSVSDVEGNVSALSQTADAIKLQVSSVEGDVSALDIKANEIEGRVTDNENNIASLSIRSDEISARVSDNEDNVAELSVTADEIRSEVKDAAGSIASLSITADAISSRVADAEGNVAILQQTADGISSAVFDNSGNISQLIQTSALLASQISDNAGNISQIQQTASSLSARVSDVEGSAAELKIDAESIKADVSDVNGNLASLRIAADDITSEVSDISDNISVIEQRADIISASVADNSGNISTLVQTASGLASRVSNLDGEYSELKQTTDSLTSRIADTEGNLSILSQTADSLTSRIVDAEGNISILRQTADSLASSISDNRNNISSLIQTAQSLTSTVADNSNSISLLQQTANSISLSVDNLQDGLLETGINISDRTVTIRSDNFYLVGNSEGAPAALKVVYDSSNIPKISVENLDIDGMLSTSSWSAEKLSIYNDAVNTANNYTDGQYSDSNSTAQQYFTNTLIPEITDAYNDAIAALSEEGGDIYNLATRIQAAENNLSDIGYLTDALTQGSTAIGGGLVLSSLIQLGFAEDGENWQVWSGINGVRAKKASGNGIAAWYGGEMLDRDVKGNDDDNRAATSLFRFDGSGYLASGAISWGASGDLHLGNTVYLGNATDIEHNQTVESLLNILDTVNSIAASVAEFSTWFHDDEITISGQTYRVLRIAMNGDDSSSTDFVGVVFNGFLYTGGDQIISTDIASTGSSGSGSGLSYLSALLDVSSGISGKPTAAKMLLYNPSGTDKNGNAGAWEYADVPTGSVTQVNISSTAYLPTGGIITLPAYPTSLPASDVYDWAKASAKPPYALSEISGTDDLQAIEALTGTSGLLRKTAANTWSLDSTSYATTSDLTTALSGVYSKTQVDNLLAGYQEAYDFTILGTTGATYNLNSFVMSSVLTSTYYSKTQVDSLLEGYQTALGFTLTGTKSQTYDLDKFLTVHQNIYALTVKDASGTVQLTYTPNAGAGSLTLTKSLVGLGNVENTALSTWAGSTAITTLGTITSGVWKGTAIGNAYLANSSLTIGSTAIALGATALSLAGLDSVETDSLTIGSATITYTDGYLYINAPLVTSGDQSIINGSSSGGSSSGSGAGYLHELGDVYTDSAKSKVLRSDGNDAADDDLLQYDATLGKWSAVAKATLLSGYATTTAVSSAISTALTDFAKTSDLTFANLSGTATASQVPAIQNLTGFSDYVYSAKASRTANTVLAAPNGSAGVATFRKLVAADLPDLSGTYATLSYVTSAVNTAVSSVLRYRGTSTTAVTDGGTETATIGGSALTATTGDVVLYGNKEFVWSGSAWEELGDEASWALKSVKVSGDGTYITGGGTLSGDVTLSLNPTYYGQWNAAYGNSHTHDNKSVLDGITSAKVSAWDAKQDAISDLSTIRSNASLGATAYGWGDHSAAGYLLATTAASTYLPLSGGTMTGRLTTSDGGVAFGSRMASATTVPDLVDELRLTSGSMGSVNITTAYNSVGAGWYNFIWIPHRTGGISGTENGDNTAYGTLLLFGMTVEGRWKIRYTNKAIGSCISFGAADTATALATTRTLWGQSFNGSANVTGSLSSVTNITMSGSLKIGSATLSWNSDGYLYIDSPLVTAGDQSIVNASSSSGGSGSGAGYLYELNDVDDDLLTPTSGQVLYYNGTEWTGKAASEIGGVTSVVGLTGAVSVGSIASALTAAGYELTDTTYSAATSSAAGLMSAADKAKLDGIASGANTYTLPAATASALGGIKTGYSTSASSRNYAVVLDSSSNAYVNVPWVAYGAGTGITLTSTNTFTLSSCGTAGTVGTSSATSGNTIAIPYVTFDAYGRETAWGTHTHTLGAASTYGIGSIASGNTGLVTGGTVYSALASYLPLSGGTMTGSIVLGTSGAEIKRRMYVDTSNCLALGSWYATDGTTQIATIQYHNTAHRLLLNPLGSTDVWNDVAGNYTLKIGQNELTYNTYAIIHAGNLSSYTATLQSNLGLGSLAYKSSLAFSELSAHPTTLSGYGITDSMCHTFVVSKGDYQHYIVLLCRIGTNTTNTAHVISGTFWTTQGGAARYQAAEINVHHSDWSYSQDNYYKFTPFGLGTMCRLVTCTYNSEAYLAVTFSNTQACNIYFDGTTSNILLTPILYNNSSTGVVNSEIYSSIADVAYNKTPLIPSAYSVYHTGNLSLATLAGSSAIGGATTPIYYNGSALTAGTALGGAAYYSATSSVTSGSTALVTSGAVYSGLAGKTNYTFVHFTDLGYTAGDTVDLYDFLVKLYSVYGNTARSIIFNWAYANAGFITDGTTTVRLAKTLMYIAYNNLTTTTLWCYGHGYLVGDNGEFYTFDCSVGSTAGTTQTKTITYVPSSSYVYANYVNITGAQTISGAKTFSAAAAFSSTLSVSGATTLSSTLSVSGQLTTSGGIKGNYFSIDDSSTNPYLSLTQGGSTFYVQMYNGEMYLGNGINNSPSINSKGTITRIAGLYGKEIDSAATAKNTWGMYLWDNSLQVTKRDLSYTFLKCEIGIDFTNDRVGIMTASPSYTLDIAGTLRASGTAYLNAGLTVTGAITSTGDQSISSDLALKTNLRDIDLSVSDIAKTRAVRFDWKDGRGTSVGTIAQDWESLVPEWVHGEEGGRSLSYAQAGLVSAIVIAREVDRHETEIERLRRRVKTLEEEVKRLKAN